MVIAKKYIVDSASQAIWAKLVIYCKDDGGKKLKEM